MRTITVELFDDGLRLSNDTLGRAGEKNIVQFAINFDALRLSGLTTATLLYKPRSSPVLAMPSVEIPEGDLVTLVPDWAMAVFGITQVQLQLTGEGVETRSYIWDMRVERSLINYGDKPTPVQDWLEEVTDIIDKAESLTGLKIIDFYPSFDDLAVNVTDPSPGDAYATGDIPPYDVYVYGETSGWVNIGSMNAGGGGTGTGDGVIFYPSVSPGGTLSWENNGDLPNPSPVNLVGPKGAKGDKGDTGPQGPEGLATVPRMSPIMDLDTGKTTGYKLEWTLSNRPSAPSGVTIRHGTSPAVAVEETVNGHRVTITDADGAHSFDVLNGESADEERFAEIERDAAETDERVANLEQDMAEVKKITDNFELFVPKFANTAEGEMLVLTDSADGALQGMTVYGKTTQATTTGANLITFPYVSVNKTEHGLTYTINKDGSVGIKGTATQSGQFVFVNTGTSFADLGITDAATLSCVTRGTLGFVFDDGTSINVDPSTPSVTIAPNGKTFRIRWLSRAGVTYDETVYPMLNVGNTALPWEPYTGGAPSPSPDYPQPLNSVGDDGAVDVTIEGSGVTQTLTLLTPNGLPSVGDVYDEIDLERGVYVQRVLKTQLTSAMGWYAAGSGKRIYTEIKTLCPKAGSPIICTHAIKGEWSSDASGTIFLGTNQVGAVGFSTADFATVDAVKAFLDANAVYIVAPLITPIETPLSAEVIAAFKALKTHYPTTTIYNDESARMSVKYAADTKNYIDQKLATLAAAMVNNL